MFTLGFEKIAAATWSAKRMQKVINGIMTRTDLPRNKHNLAMAEEAVVEGIKGHNKMKPHKSLARNALSMVRTLQIKMPKKAKFKNESAKEYATNSLIGMTQRYPKMKGD